MEIISELSTWLADVEPAFAFLLALPFVVAAVGLAAHGPERRRRITPDVEPRGGALSHRSPARAP